MIPTLFQLVKLFMRHHTRLDKVKVGLLTIGQSPREDIVSEIKPLLNPWIEIQERGFLDGLSPEEIERLKPDAGETPLVTRLRESRQVELSEKRISSMLPEAIDSMQKEMKVRAVGVLCTHDFPEKEFSLPVIFPFDYLKFLTSRVLNINSLGVIIPLASQIEMSKEKWKPSVVEAKSPYAAGISWKEIAQKFIAKKVDAVILDCIGYKIKDKQEIQSFLSVPVLLPRIILSYAINQLF
jgi:protein AroM